MNKTQIQEMSRELTITDKEYTQWIANLGERYRQSQLKAAVKVNVEMLRYYWELGRDINEMRIEERWGDGVIKNLSVDLQHDNPNATGLSVRNIYYSKKFYQLYHQYFTFLPQPVAKASAEDVPQAVAKRRIEQLEDILFSIPWGHHRYIMDKYGKEPDKAFFFVKKTMTEGWSRDVLLNFMDTDLYEREGKALTNFARTLPDTTSDLAQELTKDPYNFAFTGITGRYNERMLKDALLANISEFLLELGTGFAYIGKEFRLQIGDTENFIDLLFYNLKLSCYVVIEVKIGKFEFADVGQLGGYVVACNHQLRKEGRDNPTIGLLICKSKDRIQAQYALESSNQPIGISEYDLEKFYPEKIEGTIPTIEELETKLNNGKQLDNED